MEIRAILSQYLPSVEAELREILQARDPLVGSFFDMMHYHLGWVDQSFRPVNGWSGKRLRPVMCLLAHEATGGNWHRALPAAASVEIVHNFSLAHDDIEDGDQMRRQRDTLWKVWGVPQALAVGDGLFALAYMAMERLLQRGVSASRYLEAVEVLDRCGLSLIEGQYLDLCFEARGGIGEDEYLEMVQGKTAALLGCATEIGALLATEDQVVVDHYRRFGQYLGLAFQMADDILGIWGDSQQTGKPVGNDLLRRKKTLPVVYALERSAAFQARYSTRTSHEDDLLAMLEVLEDVGARAHTERLADEYRERALEQLDQTGSRNEAQEKLFVLAEFLTARSY